MNNYISVLKNYVGFTGRANRAEFWWFWLANVVIIVVLDLIDNAIGSPVLAGIYGLAVLLPTLSVAARRLHDSDKSAWWLLLYFIPFLGWITLIVFWCLPGTPGANKHGENPDAIGAGPAAGTYAG